MSDSGSSSPPAPETPTLSWKSPLVIGPLIGALIGAAGLIAAALVTTSTSHASPERVVTTSVSDSARETATASLPTTVFPEGVLNKSTVGRPVVLLNSYALDLDSQRADWAVARRYTSLKADLAFDANGFGGDVSRAAGASRADCEAATGYGETFVVTEEQPPQTFCVRTGEDRLSSVVLESVEQDESRITLSITTWDTPFE